MHYRSRAVWALVVVVCMALLMAPALWNRFPLLQYDTGGYLARWYEGTLVPSRAVVYGLMLNAGVPLAFWPVVMLQSALALWAIALTLRTHKLGNRPLLLAGVIAAMTLATTLPWLTSILLTDIFCGVGILALYLLLLRADELSRNERIGLFILAALSAATHSATLAVMGALFVCACLIWLFDRTRIATRALASGLLALALSAVFTLAADDVVAGKPIWTPGGFALSFGRMLQDGIVKKYLDEHCPDPALRLCAVKDQLPQDADDLFWSSDLFDRLGRFEGLGGEMETIALRALIAYPLLQARSVIADTAGQLIGVHTGEGVVHWIWHTYGVIESRTPQLVPLAFAARQRTGGPDFDAINQLHYPVALIAMALLPVIVVLALRRRVPPEIGDLAATVILVLLTNAFICATFANPHDRYGARVVWLAVLAVILALARLREDRLGKVLKLP